MGRHPRRRTLVVEGGWTMLKKILVTLDGSPYSEAVLFAVAELAAETGAVVTFYRVGEPPSATPETPPDVQPPVLPRMGALYTPVRTPPRYVETRTQAIERREHELAEYLEEKAKVLRDRGIEVQVAVALGENAGQLIIDYARDNPMDLIAMATHGRTGLRSLIFGSVAGKVLASGVRPVLLVRPRELGHHSE